MSHAVTCPKCGNQAEYSAEGVMYEAKCPFCGYREAGLLEPPLADMPFTNPVGVIIDLGAAAPTGLNLFGLKNLHSKFANLSPSELKTLFLSGAHLNLPSMSLDDALAVQAKAEKLGFTAVFIE